MIFQDYYLVVPPGVEPGVFCTKNRRVANYTTGHCLIAVQRYDVFFLFAKHFDFFFDFFLNIDLLCENI